MSIIEEYFSKYKDQILVFCHFGTGDEDPSVRNSFAVSSIKFYLLVKNWTLHILLQVIPVEKDLRIKFEPFTIHFLIDTKLQFF